MHEARTRLNRSVVFAVNDGVSGLQAPDGLIRSAGEFTPLPLPRLGGSARDRSFFLNGCHRTSSIKRISIPLADRNTLVRRGYRRMRQRLGRSTPVTVGVAVRCPLLQGVLSTQPKSPTPSVQSTLSIICGVHRDVPKSRLFSAALFCMICMRIIKSADFKRS
ncbi:MAG: hypothetical protein JWM99_3521 [Verrucomicrobiales bacterium]|nr:hypothetical protein [Verrucomicrobiales bacterium]